MIKIRYIARKWFKIASDQDAKRRRRTCSDVFKPGIILCVGSKWLLIVALMLVVAEEWIYFVSRIYVALLVVCTWEWTVFLMNTSLCTCDVLMGKWNFKNVQKLTKDVSCRGRWKWGKCIIAVHPFWGVYCCRINSDQLMRSEVRTDGILWLAIEWS
jgi:hypothetical protein